MNYRTELSNTSGSSICCCPDLKKSTSLSKLKELIYTNVRTPSLIHGAKTWTSTTTDESKLVAGEVKAKRVIMRKKLGRIRNKEHRKISNGTSVLRNNEQARMRWLGKRKEERLPEQIFDSPPDGRGPAGRPRKI